MYKIKNVLIGIAKAVGAVTGMFMMLLSLAFMKAGLSGDFIGFAIFLGLQFGGLGLATVTVFSPLLNDFFERGLGRVWLDQIEQRNQTILERERSE